MLNTHHRDVQLALPATPFFAQLEHMENAANGTIISRQLLGRLNWRYGTKQFEVFIRI